MTSKTKVIVNFIFAATIITLNRMNINPKIVETIFFVQLLLFIINEREAIFTFDFLFKNKKDKTTKKEN